MTLDLRPKSSEELIGVKHSHGRPMWACALGMVVLAIVGVSVAVGEDLPKGKPVAVPNLALKQAPAGIGELSRRLGDETPTGMGITVGHVEGGKGNYAPNLDGGDYDYLNVVLRSGKGRRNSHATSTARVIYGKKGLAPGVTDVLVYASSDWLGPNYLGVGTARAPRVNNVRVFNHSWIGGGGATAIDALRRIDYLADEYNVLMVVGVNNKKQTSVPRMLASGYNQIAVGVSSGNSSGGYTRFEGDGRCKPDVVSSRSQTSFSTPMVTSVVARLLEASDRTVNPRLSGHSEVIKACLMAGASKSGSWKQVDGHPLDEHLGAGSVRLDLSYDILMAGPIAPTTGSGYIDSRYGWDFRESKVGETNVYRFKTMRALEKVSMMLVWNRRIDGRVMNDLMSGRRVWNTQPRLANFDLSLVLIDTYGEEQEISASRSTVDNVEHLYFRNLPRGEYEMRVTRDDQEREAWDYALAWRMDLAAAQDATRAKSDTDADADADSNAQGEASDLEPKRIHGQDGAVLDLSGLIDTSKLDEKPAKP